MGTSPNGQRPDRLLAFAGSFDAPPAAMNTLTSPPSAAAPTPQPGPDAKADADADAEKRRIRDTHLSGLLAQAAQGNASAFEAFYDATMAHAQALARRMLPPSDVEDILADAFFQAWRDATRFDPQRGGPVTWLLTIVRSRALDWLRHRRASPEVDAGDEMPDIAGDAPGPETLLAHAQSNSRLQAALVSLSANERWVLGLAYYREMAHSAIAECTGLPLGTVKSLILRAQHKLREQLAC
jgi:RNA polymerase sigma-70 factor, ECF subfamily